MRAAGQVPLALPRLLQVFLWNAKRRQLIVRALPGLATGLPLASLLGVLAAVGQG
jgi:hypothetical protein